MHHWEVHIAYLGQEIRSCPEENYDQQQRNANHVVFPLRYKGGHSLHGCSYGAARGHSRIHVKRVRSVSGVHAFDSVAGDQKTVPRDCDCHTREGAILTQI